MSTPNTASDMPQIQTTISPIDQKPVLTRPLQTEEQLDHVIAESVKAYKSWRKVPLDDRLKIAEQWMVRSPPFVPHRGGGLSYLRRDVDRV
jgi:acyl-CoA reductase-like NAD-dependent aldehyde dehydrogenase